MDRPKPRLLLRILLTISGQLYLLPIPFCLVFLDGFCRVIGITVPRSYGRSHLVMCWEKCLAMSWVGTCSAHSSSSSSVSVPPLGERGKAKDAPCLAHTLQGRDGVNSCGSSVKVFMSLAALFQVERCNLPFTYWCRVLARVFASWPWLWLSLFFCFGTGLCIFFLAFFVHVRLITVSFVFSIPVGPLIRVRAHRCSAARSHDLRSVSDKVLEVVAWFDGEKFEVVMEVFCFPSGLSLHYFFSFVSFLLSFVRGLGVSSTGRAARATWSHTFPFGSTGTFPEKFHVKAKLPSASQGHGGDRDVFCSWYGRPLLHDTASHARTRGVQCHLRLVVTLSLHLPFCLLLLFGIPLPNTPATRAFRAGF